MRQWSNWVNDQTTLNELTNLSWQLKKAVATEGAQKKHWNINLFDINLQFYLVLTFVIPNINLHFSLRLPL